MILIFFLHNSLPFAIETLDKSKLPSLYVILMPETSKTLHSVTPQLSLCLHYSYILNNILFSWNAWLYRLSHFIILLGNMSRLVCTYILTFCYNVEVTFVLFYPSWYNRVIFFFYMYICWHQILLYMYIFLYNMYLIFCLLLFHST